LDRDAQGKPEQQVGSTIVAAEEPDWPEVVKQASALLTVSKDLRVAMHLVRGLLRTAGFRGFALGLEVLYGFLSQFWDHVHPQLDPDDGNDPTMRMNILAELCDATTVVRWVHQARLVEGRGVGWLALRDVEIATGESPVPASYEREVPDGASIEAAFLGADPAEVEATHAAIRQARQHTIEIEALVTDRVGAGHAVNLGKLTAVLERAEKTLERYVVRADGSAAASGPEAGAERNRLEEGEITSRDDVVRAIDRLCSYYQRSEPSSPIPMLLSRCRRLVNKDFLSIIRDMAPDGLGQVETLRGRTEEEEEENGSS
jgi:type VI secretion system protein ImpA